MAVWLWIYDNELALYNWRIAQPSNEKNRVNNLSYFKDAVFPFWFSMVRSRNCTVQICAINKICLQVQSSDSQEG